MKYTLFCVRGNSLHPDRHFLQLGKWLHYNNDYVILQHGDLSDQVAGQIMAADKVLLIALGTGKAEILEKSLFGPVTPNVPASILQFFKGEVIVCADEAALTVIKANHNI